MLLGQRHGFRDTKLFNLALLAHRAWRILQCPESLSAKVLTTSLASRRLKVWRVRLDGLDTLKLGLIRRIISREGTDPWEDNWLYGNCSLRTTTWLLDGAPLCLTFSKTGGNPSLQGGASWASPGARETPALFSVLFVFMFFIFVCAFFFDFFYTFKYST